MIIDRFASLLLKCLVYFMFYLLCERLLAVGGIVVSLFFIDRFFTDNYSLVFLTVLMFLMV